MEFTRHHMFLVGAIIAFFVIAFIVVHNSLSNQQIVPATPNTNSTQQEASDLQTMLGNVEQSMQSSNSDLATNLSQAMTALQTQIQSMPAGATQDQLNSALSDLMTNIQTAIDTGNTSSVTSINNSLTAMQTAINNSGAANTSQIMTALNNLQSLISANANNLSTINNNVTSLSTWLKTQLQTLQGIIQSNIPKFVPFTAHDMQDLGWLEGGLGFFSSGATSQQKISEFVQAFRNQFPQYNNLISGTTLTDIGFSVFDSNGSQYGKIKTSQQFADYLNQQFANLPH